MTTDAVDRQALVEQFDLSALTPDFYRNPYPWFQPARQPHHHRDRRNRRRHHAAADPGHAVHRRRQPRPGAVSRPYRFDIGRMPNRHVAFASGIHQCAGMNLARLEGRIALSAFLARFTVFALLGAPVRGGRARFRGFLEIPARLG
jgi:hypothetical protein